MRGTILAVISAMLLCATDARATTEEWYRTFFGHYAATLRYLQHGEATPGINELYVREVCAFLNAEDARLGVYCAARPTMGAYGPSWTFFGARFLPLPNASGSASFYGVSYMGSNVSFHSGDGFDAFLSPNMVAAGMNRPTTKLSEAGLRKQYVSAHGYAGLSRGGNYAPLSWNSADMDGDGKGDLAFGGLLFLSGDEYATSVSPVRDVGAEVAFVTTQAGVRAVLLKDGWLSVMRLQGKRLSEEMRVSVGRTEVNAGHALTVMPGRDGDRVAVRGQCGLQLYSFHLDGLTADACIGGLIGRWAMPGARGDFDRDGVDDVWIAETVLGAPDAARQARVSLVSGSRLETARGQVSLADLSIARLAGSTRFSDYDGLGTTLSPFAGDLDGDGRPDLTVSGHRHMSEAGAMFVLLGKDIRPGLELSVTDRRIRKIVGPLMSQLAPPFHHWDATDFDGDGHDDIVVPADNDLCGGLNAGAIYLLSGRKIVAR